MVYIRLDRIKSASGSVSMIRIPSRSLGNNCSLASPSFTSAPTVLMLVTAMACVRATGNAGNGLDQPESHSLGSTCFRCDPHWTKNDCSIPSIRFPHEIDILQAPFYTSHGAEFNDKCGRIFNHVRIPVSDDPRTVLCLLM